MSETTFIQQCLRGDALSSDVNDFVDAWHEAGTDLPLYAFLGMTHDEYKLWLEKPAALDLIISARQGNPVKIKIPTPEETDNLRAEALNNTCINEVKTHGEFNGMEIDPEILNIWSGTYANAWESAGWVITIRDGHSTCSFSIRRDKKKWRPFY